MPSKQFYKDNREKYLDYSRQYRRDNPKKIKKHNKKYKRDNPGLIKKIKRESRIKRRYGLSYEDWLEMWETQNGQCAICERMFAEPSSALVDHDHKTGKIRGLLCRKCNLGIGHFDDNLEIAIKAVRYLSKWEK